MQLSSFRFLVEGKDMRSPIFIATLCLCVGALLLACTPIKPIPTATSSPADQTIVARFATPTAHTTCAYTAIEAKVWEDLNGNGTKDLGELSLANVCVSTSYSSSYDEKTAQETCTTRKNWTNQNGDWTADLMHSCGSPEQIDAEIKARCKATYIFVVPPPGYKSTTPKMVNDCEAQFGLVRVSTPPS